MVLKFPDRNEILNYLLSFNIFEQIGRSNEGVEYITTHLDRLIKTVKFIPQIKGRARVLELGAAPYFMTLMIVKYLGYEVTPSNFFGDYGEPAFGEDEVTIKSAHYKETYTFRFKIFNVERDPFPYEDGEFDIVLCCEILEHLIMDPSHMLKEIHRVLKPNGFLIITTPNSIRLENIFSLLRGKTIFYPYSGFGVYGRHNREFTPSEVVELLKLHNFKVHIFTEDVYSHSFFYRLMTWLGPMRWRKDNLFCLGQSFGTSIRSYPESLYSHQTNRRNISSNTIIMGESDIFQLGSGWHGLENWPPKVRWTGKEAEAELKLNGNETTFCFRGYPGPKPAEGEIWVNGYKAGDFLLESNKPEVMLPLPKEIQQYAHHGNLNVIKIKFHIKNPFVGMKEIPSSTDKRELGIAIERIWLE